MRAKIKKLEAELLGINQRSSWKNRFFDLSLDLLCVCRIDGTFRQLNSAWERITGWSAQQLMQHPVVKGIHPEDLSSFEKALQKCRKGESVFDQKCRFKSAGGEWLWLSWNIYPVPEEEIFFAVIRNINGSQDINERLKDSEARYRAFVEQSSEGIWHLAFKEPIPTDLSTEQQVRLMYNSGHVSECNIVFARMYGYQNCQEIKGKSLIDLYGSNDRTENYEANRKFISSHYRIDNVETLETNTEGEKKFFLNNAIGIVRDGYLTGIWGTQRDITSQKLAEEKLRQNEANYLEIFNSYSEAIFIHDIDTGRIIDVNETTLKMYGLKDHEEALRYLNEQYPSDHNSFNFEKAHKRIKQAVEEGPQQFEWLGIKKNGQPFWVEVILKSIWLAGLQRVIAMVKDIDDRKYAQDALKENELRYRTLFESSSDAIFIVNYNTIVDCNIKSLQVFSASRGMVIGQNIQRFFLPVSGDFNLDDHLAHAQSGEENIFEWKCQNYQGEPFDAEVKISTVLLGNVNHLQFIIRDLSETRRALETARSSEEKFSVMFRATPNAIAIFRQSDQRLLDVNGSFERMSGYTRQELIGKTWSELNLLRSKASYKELYRQFAKTGQVLNYEFDYVDKNERVITTLLSLKSIVVDGEECVLSIAHDISKRKQVEKELRYHSQFEKLVSEISTRFINLPSADIDAQIRIVLEEICDFTGTNVGYVFKISDNWTRRDLTHYWSKKNSVPEGLFKRFASQEIKKMPLWMGKIADQKVVALSSPADLPELALEEKGFLNESGLQAVIDIPMIYQEKVFGILGIGCSGQTRLWTENEIALLKMVGQIITNALLRKEVEKALRDSEVRFRSIIQHMMDIVWIIDEKGRVLFETPSASRVLGYDNGYMIGKIGFELIHPDDKKQMFTDFQEVLEKKNDFIPSEFRFKHRDGHWVELEVVANNLLNHEEIRGIIISARDISNKKQTENALIESEQKYRNIFNKMQDVYFEVTPGGIILEISPAIGDITGRSRESLIGQSMAVLYKNPAHSSRFLERIEEKQTLSDYEVILITDNEEERICSINAEVNHGEKEPQDRIIGSIRNITDNKKLMDQLNQSQKMESIGTLAGGIAHDFNNLLTVILGHAELVSLNMEKSNPFYKDIISILNAGHKAEKLTRQLLTFSRKQMFEPRVVNLNNIIVNLEKMMGRLIGEDIRVETRLSEDIGNIKADPGQIEQVLINLLVNARDAIQDEENVTQDKYIILETGEIYLDREIVNSHPGASEGRFVYFTVSDSGIGMSEDTRSKIFEPFFTTKSKDKGTGLGLSTVYGIVKQNQGSIYVYSEPGRGTTIKIYWPLSSESEIPTEKTVAVEEDLTGNESILLVEDDESVRSFAGAALRSFGYYVYEAENGDCAIEMVKENNKKIDLVLTDVVMPGMDGRELAIHIGELIPKAKILFTSGYTDNHILEKGIIDQELNFLSKPYSTQALAEKIRQVLKS